MKKTTKTVIVDENNNDGFGETVDVNGTLSNGTDPNYKFTIKWRNVLGMILFHVMGFYGIFLLVTDAHVWYTALWGKKCAKVLM